MQKLYVLLNAKSGSVGALAGSPADLQVQLENAGYEAIVDADPDASFEQRLNRAKASDADTILAAGGDGTATAAAGAAMESGKRLAILPLGTANLLGRDLGLALDPVAWMGQLPTLVPHEIDVGRVNGRIFLHKVAIGFVPDIAAARERLRDRKDLGAKLAFLGYAFRRIARARHFNIELTQDDGKPHTDRVQALAVANNRYDEQLGHFFARSQLDAGELTLYLLDHLTVVGSLRLGLGLFLGRWQDDVSLTVATAKAVTIGSRHKRVKVMLDGEVEALQSPLTFEILPRALTVMASPAIGAGHALDDPEADQIADA